MKNAFKDVEMIFEQTDRYTDYAYSYYNHKTSKYMVYCPVCKKFEEMGLLTKYKKTRDHYTYCNLTKTCNFDKKKSQKKEEKNNPNKVYKEGLKYYLPNAAQNILNTHLIGRRHFRKKIDKQMEFLYYICPNCTNKIDVQQVHYFETRQERNVDYCYGIRVFAEDSKNGKLLKIIHLFIEYGVWNDHLITHRYRKKITLNLDTGFSYLLSTKRIDGSNKNYKQAPIKNITYGDTPYGIAYFLTMDRAFNTISFYSIYDYILSYKTKLLGHEPDGYSNNLLLDNINFKNKNKLEVLIALNRFPNIPYETLTKITRIRSQFDFAIDKRIYKIKHDDDKWIDCIIKFHNLDNTKFIKKLIMNGARPQDISIITEHITQPNNIVKISKMSYSLEGVFLSDLFLDLKARFKETGAINKICEVKQKYILDDTIRMYSTAKIALGKYSLNGTIKEIHDNLSLDIKKLKSQNFELNYTEEQLKLEVTNDSKYDLLFAKTTHELIDVGSNMHICVGSYDLRAVNKECYILVLRNKKLNPIVCIELSSNCKVVVQAKYSYNSRMPVEEYNFVMEWCKKHKLDTTKTYDLQSPQQTAN